MIIRHNDLGMAKDILSTPSFIPPCSILPTVELAEIHPVQVLPSYMAICITVKKLFVSTTQIVTLSANRSDNDPCMLID